MTKRNFRNIKTDEIKKLGKNGDPIYRRKKVSTNLTTWRLRK